MKMVLELLLLSTPLIIHLSVDFKGKVNHKLNAIYVLLLSILIGKFLNGYFWQGAFFSLCIHFSFFDPLYNLMHKQKLFYHGSSINPDRALTDKFWDYLPPYAELFVRIWVFGVGYFVYYHLDKIISYQ